MVVLNSSQILTEDIQDEDLEIVPRTYEGNPALFKHEAWMTAIRGKHPSRALS